MKINKVNFNGEEYVADRRDSQFQLKTAYSARVTRYWNPGTWNGNQGSNPTCVGFGWAHWLYCQPIKQYLDPDGIYYLSQYLDEWVGQNYDGTSVRAGAKVLHKLGAIKSYEWTTNVEVLANTILNTGPVVVGTNWYRGMSYPTPSGVINLSGPIYGRHCYLITGYSKRNEYFRIKNSWGTDWGRSGVAYIKKVYVQRLLKERGVACIGIEKVITP